MKHCYKPRRGFATVMALVSLSLVGVTIAGMMTHIAMQARRTEADRIRAQREQIVIAKTLCKGLDAATLPPELSHFH